MILIFKTKAIEAAGGGRHNIFVEHTASAGAPCAGLAPKLEREWS
jgi:hypothetical protein